MALTPRLRLVYEMLGEGDTLIDVGCDHGYLPIELIKDGKYRRAVASDIAPQPLESAVKNVSEAGLSDSFEFVCTDGLLNIGEPDGKYSVSVCGMGGEMIASVLASNENVAHGAASLVLQPMTKEERLRRFLWDNGYAIERECAAAEGEKLYIAFLARYTGAAVKYTDDELYLGKRGSRAASDAMTRRMSSLCDRYRKISEAKGNSPDEGRIADAAESELEEMMK